MVLDCFALLAMTDLSLRALALQSSKTQSGTRSLLRTRGKGPEIYLGCVVHGAPRAAHEASSSHKVQSEENDQCLRRILAAAPPASSMASRAIAISPSVGTAETEAASGDVRVLTLHWLPAAAQFRLVMATVLVSVGVAVRLRPLSTVAVMCSVMELFAATVTSFKLLHGRPAGQVKSALDENVRPAGKLS